MRVLIPVVVLGVSDVGGTTGKVGSGADSLPGSSSPPNLIGLLQASWVHVLSYPFILGWSLLEAMACGCCIVGSRGMPVQEVIHDGVEGVLAPMADPNKLAQKILALLANPSMRDQLGAAARQSALGWDQG